MKNILTLAFALAFAFQATGADDSDFRRQIQSTTFTRSLLTATNAAVARDILEVSAGIGFINVSDYAVGDGVANDTAALQAAADLVTSGKTLYSLAGKTYLITNSITLTNSRVRVDFSGSTIKFTGTTRRAALQIGPTVSVVSGMDFAISTATNYVTGVPSSTFAAGDMVMLYNSVESPANYNPGQLAFVTEASGTTMTLDRFPDTDLQVTNAYRFAAAPEGIEIRNVVVDLSGATDGIGISAIGRGHIVEGCRVIGTRSTNDPNYIGIELRGQSITARKNFVQGILDAGNATDRSGYGIFATGDNITVENNELLDCKHCVSTSERKAISHEIKVTNNRIRQRDDWAGLTDVNGAYLFLGALDVHSNVRHIEFRGNDVKIGGRYALSLRNGNFDVVFNRIEVTAQTLPFAQHTIGLAEEMTDRALFQGNQFITAEGATLMYFAQADSAVSGTHSNLSFIGNTVRGAILSLDDYDTTAAVTNGFQNTVILGNTFIRNSGTTVLFSGPSSNAIVTGNAFTHAGSGVSIAVPGDDTTNPPRQIYIAGNTFNRVSGTAGDVRVLSGPTNIVELGNNHFSDVPTQGFDGRVAVSRTPPSSERYQMIEADEDELFFNSPTGTTSARLKWGGTGALLGNDTEFVSYRTLVTDRAFASYHTDTNGLPFVDQYQFVIKADGLMSWSDGDNAAQIVLGPRRNADVTNGVIRLSGGFGLTEHADPITPSSTTATIWLEEADSSKSIKIKWPDGSNTALYPQAGGGTNASTVYIEGTQVDAPNFTQTTELDWTVTGGTNVAVDIRDGSIATNRIDATFRALLLAGGTGGGDVYLASNNVFTGDNTMSNLTVNGDLTVGNLEAASLALTSPLGLANGGTGGTNAETARIALGTVYDTDVQAYRLELLQAATALSSDGHMVYRNASLVTNLTSTAAGRVLLTAATASAQWAALLSSATTTGVYNASSWDGIADRAPTLDQVRDAIEALPGGSNSITSVTAPLTLTNGVLGIDTTGLGGSGGGYTYLVTNVGGAFQSRTAGTNWTIFSTTVSSNYAPSATGKLLDGGWSLVMSNYSGTTANIFLNITANGTTVFRDAVSLNNGSLRGQNSVLWIARESDTTAAIITLGSQAGPAAIGQGDFGATVAGALTISTNVAWNWSTNNTLLVELQCDTSTSTNDALGMRLAHAYLRAEAAAGSGTGDVVGPASSTTNNIAVFADATGKLIADGGVTVASLATEAEVAAGYEPINANKYQATNANLTTLAGASLTGSGDFVRGTSPTLASPTITGTLALDAATVGTLTVTNPFPARAVTNATASRFAVWGSDYRLTNDVAETGTGAPVRAASPALSGDPTAPTASANDNDTSIATTAYVQAEETAMRAANYWQATNAALTALAGNPSMYQASNTVLTTLATLNAASLTNLNASELRSGTVPTNRLAASITGKQDALVNSAGLAGAISDETGSGVAAFATAPTFTGATLNGSVVFGQTTLAAHSSVTNFVVDPTVSPFQTINADMTTPAATFSFLHATNVAAGRQTTVLVFAGTNATVTVSLAAQFARNTNSVALTVGQVLPISFYGYGSSPTNVIATMGTPYSR